MIAYVPVIKGKEADLRAIGSLSSAVRGSVKPLVDMPFARSSEAGSPEERAQKFCDLIRKHLPLGGAFVDFYALEGSEVCRDGSNVVAAGFEMLRACGRHVTPTYDLARSEKVWTPLRAITQSFGQGFCFRLSRDDISLPEDTWPTILQRASNLGLRLAEVDLMLDLRSVTFEERHRLK